MRFSHVSPVLVAALALIIAGCGKTREHQKMESDINAEVMALQKNVASNLARYTDLQTKLDATLKMHKELMKKYAKRMKGHTAEDIAAAKRGLDAAKGEAETALKALTAYDERMDHEQAMQKLNLDRESLMRIKDVVVGAMSAANVAIDDHEKMKSGLTAKAPAKASAKSSHRGRPELKVLRDMRQRLKHLEATVQIQGNSARIRSSAGLSRRDY